MASNQIITKDEALSTIRSIGHNLFSERLNQYDADRVAALLNYLSHIDDQDCIVRCIDSLGDCSRHSENMATFGEVLHNSKHEFIVPKLLSLLEATSSNILESALFLLQFTNDNRCVSPIMAYISGNNTTSEGVELAREILDDLITRGVPSLTRQGLNELIPEWFKDGERSLHEREQAYHMELAITKANTALAAKDYRGVINILKPFENMLNSEGRRKLKIAEIRLRS